MSWHVKFLINIISKTYCCFLLSWFHIMMNDGTGEKVVFFMYCCFGLFFSFLFLFTFSLFILFYEKIVAISIKFLTSFISSFFFFPSFSGKWISQFVTILSTLSELTCNRFSMGANAFSFDLFFIFVLIYSFHCFLLSQTFSMVSAF